MVRPGALLLELLLGGSLAAQAPAVNVQDKFPESEDKEAVTSTCSACHTLARVASNNRDKAQWTQTVKAHDSRGLKLDADETAVIVRYLAAYFGPKVYVNTATVEELSSLPKLDRKLAERVVRYRDAHGPFQTIESLIAVMGPESFSPVRNRLSIGK